MRRTGEFKRIANWWTQKRKERAEALMFEREVIVRFDNAGISVAYPSGTVQSIFWHEINCVATETNDSGPWGADVWWLLEGTDRRCTYPRVRPATPRR